MEFPSPFYIGLKSALITSLFLTAQCELCYECSSLTQKGCLNSLEMTFPEVNCSGNCMKLVADAFDGLRVFVRTCDVSGFPPDTCHVTSHMLNFFHVMVCVCHKAFCNGAPTTISPLLLTFVCTLLVNSFVTYMRLQYSTRRAL